MMKITRVSKYIFFTTVLFLFCNKSYSQDVAAGAAIFKQECAKCHYVDSDAIGQGPSLKGVTQRRSKEWLKKWITNSQALIKSGDKDAIEVWERFDKVAMASFDFNDAEHESLYAYLQNPPPPEESSDIVADAAGGVLEDDGMKGSTQLMILALVLLILTYILISVKDSLKKGLDEETTSVKSSVSSFFSKTVNKVFVGLFVVIIILKFVYDAMMGVGVMTNYQPDQPIAFSHKLHAGEYGIDCNYCHSSASKSKHSGIPSVNVCMNCHNSIAEGPSGTAEIQKIYDAVGYDPKTKKYIPGYKQKPIEWVRIHNLPDLAYFNHSQHVNVAGLECQECHGPIEEMDVVKQHSELTMGWCIECHRETEVNFEGNDYYAELHRKLKKKYKGEKITVDKIGGLECGKCHY